MGSMTAGWRADSKGDCWVVVTVATLADELAASMVEK
jgi:hypothetical protein